MLDDRQFVMRPGYKFPSPMSYKQMCQQVNMEVQKVGSDAVRPKIRKTVSIGGRMVPASVQFYCCHKRQHKKKDKPAKTPTAKRADRCQEGRSYLFSKCTCCFTIVVDPSQLQGAGDKSDESTGDEGADTDAEVEDTTVASTEKKGELSSNATDFMQLWMVPSVPARAVASARTGKKGRKPNLCFKHCGHPKRTLAIGDINDAMQ